MATSVKHEAVHADLLIPSDAHPLYQFLLVANRGESCHKPAVSIVALSHVIRGCASDVELWVVEDVLMSLSALRFA
jgi:hypothetical protein